MLTYEEAEAKQRLFDANSMLLSNKECAAIDEFVKHYALKSFRRKINHYPRPLREYLMTMVNAHYGSVETDALLTHYKCYPDFVK